MGDDSLPVGNPGFKSTLEFQECKSEANKYQERYGKYKIEIGKKRIDYSVPWFLCGYEEKGREIFIIKRRLRVGKIFPCIENTTL